MYLSLPFARSRYLVRVDDICPTMRWDIWSSLESILLENEIVPILAVIPDNRDLKLYQHPARNDFWDRVREWQRRGWSIGLHGYQHLYRTSKPGLVGLNHYSEFAGLPYRLQYESLFKATAILNREGIHSDLWVAPAHTFDTNTLIALRTLGIHHVSDGHHLYPYTDSQGILWIPQQLGRFRTLPVGLWTVCIHLDDFAQSGLDDFRKTIERFRLRFTSLPEVIDTYRNSSSTSLNRSFGRVIRWSKQMKRITSRFMSEALS